MGRHEQPQAITKRVSIENGETLFLDYRLQTYASTSNDVALYGIKVCKRNHQTIQEEAETYAITDCRNKAVAIMVYLSNGTVPPCVLMEMVDEWFSREVWEQEHCKDVLKPPTRRYRF